MNEWVNSFNFWQFWGVFQWIVEISSRILKEKVHALLLLIFPAFNIITGIDCSCYHPQSLKSGPYSSCTENKAGAIGRKWIWGIFVGLQQGDLLTIKMSEVREEIHRRGVSIPIFSNDLRPGGAIWIMSREYVTDVSPRPPQPVGTNGIPFMVITCDLLAPTC